MKVRTKKSSFIIRTYYIRRYDRASFVYEGTFEVAAPAAGMQPRVENTDKDRNQVEEKHTASTTAKLLSCFSLFILAVAGTFCYENSKNSDNSYPYDTFVIAFAAEVLKFFISVCCLTSVGRRSLISAWNEPRKLASFALPAILYFVSNNSAPLIIQELGPTAHQVLNNLKIIATGIFTRVILHRRLTWSKWAALALLLFGSVLVQLPRASQSTPGNAIYGYTYVLASVSASGAGSVVSELLLKADGTPIESNMNMQNAKLYFFGILCGLASAVLRHGTFSLDIFNGLNLAACGAIVTMTLAGLCTSFILKYIDSIAKCFVMSCSMLAVALGHSVMKGEWIGWNVLCGIFLVSIATKNYHVAPS